MTHNLNMSMIQGFSSLMYVNFIIKKKYRVDEVAKEMQIANDTLYRYIRGENIIPPDRIIDLIRATNDIEYLEFFCDPVDFMPVKKVSGKKIVLGSVKHKEVRTCILNGKAIETCEKALEDKVITHNEYIKLIHPAINKARRALAELDNLMLGKANQ